MKTFQTENDYKQKNKFMSSMNKINTEFIQISSNPILPIEKNENKAEMTPFPTDPNSRPNDKISGTLPEHRDHQTSWARSA